MMEIMQTRRSFLTGAGALAASTVFGGVITTLATPALAAAQHSEPLRLTNPHTGEAYDVELFIDGAWNANALIVCDYMLRDWRQKESVQCDRKLYAALYVIQTYFGPKQRVQINSGFRTQKTNELLREQGYSPAVNSQHLYAKAVDFTIAGARLRDVAKAVRALGLGGTGLYLDDGFVHMDTRGRAAQWGDSF